VINEALDGFDGLVCVGGDGMFAELCHGLLLRAAHDGEIDIDNRQVNIVRPNLRIGIIPAGSTDAVVFGTTGLNDPVTSALQIIVGESLAIDITTVKETKTLPNPTPMYRSRELFDPTIANDIRFLFVSFILL
jgi:ceramide kinase